MLARVFVFVLLLLPLSGCSISSPSASKAFIHYDFSQLKSYRLLKPDSEFGELQSIKFALRNNIEFAIEQQLEQLALNYQNDDQADIIVSYYLINNSASGLKRYNKAVNFCYFCRDLYQASNDKKNLPMKPGSLIVDFIDNKSKRSVWRGVAPLKISAKDNSLEVNDKLHLALTSMFVHYPK